MYYDRPFYWNIAVPPGLINEPERSELARREREEAQARVVVKRALRLQLRNLNQEIK